MDMGQADRTLRSKPDDGHKYEWEVQQLFGGRWEMVTTEPTQALAIQRMHEYDHNQPEIEVRVKRVRIK